MTDMDRLTMLKIDLGISTSTYDERLTQYLKAAKIDIEREGITFPPDISISDEQLIVMYAAWSWRKRATGEGMPRMLRYALNNRLFEQKAGDGDG
ncbi:MAG: phage head-tail connector protein [Clostridium sp.]|nr:phage head-tail connector protein [Clostridium sp.]MCM1400250.1 phage head-tail connector protein [Clostridium sp.]MCM1460963.1 phage head-tail connector protein [Bacteroides sp.]